MEPSPRAVGARIVGPRCSMGSLLLRPPTARIVGPRCSNGVVADGVGETFYDAVGGAETFRTIVSRFRTRRRGRGAAADVSRGKT